MTIADADGDVMITEPAPLVRCLRCEYDLRGQPRAGGQCPECGTEVEPSWQRHEAEAASGLPPLRLSSTGWLRAMGWACCAMIVAVLATAFEATRVFRSSAWDGSLNMVGMAAGFLQLGAVSVSLWLFGTREPLAPRNRRGGAGGGLVSRVAVRVAAVLLLALPFAAVALLNRFSFGFRLYTDMSILSAVLAGLATWVAVRRLAAGVRRARHRGLARLATAFAWVAPVVWVAHSIFNPSMPYQQNSEWLLNAHPIVGFVESAILLPRALVLSRHWSDGARPLLPWIPEALVSVIGMILLAVGARVFLGAAKRSPRAASPE
jgi:hypothetical protein